MNNPLSCSFIRLASASVFLSSLLLAAACSSAQEQGQKAVQEFLKNQGVRELKTDAFYTDPAFPDKAYISVDVTYNFASSRGTPQHDYMGFILAREGKAWKIEKNTYYTKDEQKAREILSGQRE
jgi:hypothetical protein